MKRILLMFTILAALTATLLTGCGTQTAEEPAAETPVAEEAAAPAVEAPTAENPIVIDAENKQVLVYAEVNRKFVTEPTRHGVVTAEGSNGDKSIFRAGGNALEFNKALFEIGGTAGENVKKDSPAGTVVEGDGLNITVAWDDKEYPINDLVVSTGKEGGKALEPRFGGNYDFQSEAKTGCLFCLDSCAAGITSSAATGWQAFANGDVEFRGNGDLLPADGTPVVITFAL
ncbi:MAG: hypothetical protein Kow0067_12530 [Coriobacteriia bacterium]